jgi:hypothetical protein
MKAPAMYKVLHFVKRKDHLTHEQFKAHFERSHAAMAIKFCGHLYSEYRRNYIEQAWWGGDARDPASAYCERDWTWDLISEWILPDKEALQEIYRVMQQPEYDRLFHEDEDRIIDRTVTVTVGCDVRDVGTAFNAKGTVFDTPTGEPSWEGWDAR